MITHSRCAITARPLGFRPCRSTHTQLHSLDGEPFDLDGLKGKAVLVVNVASKCGLPPQYTGLEELQKTYADRGFTVLGVPCNQFGGQEPGTAEEISTFCSATYGVTFPITEKVDVNGQKQPPALHRADGEAGCQRRCG